MILDTEDFAKTFDERMDRSRPVSIALLEINRLFSMDIIVYSKGDFVREVKDTGREIYAK